MSLEELRTRARSDALGLFSALRSCGDFLELHSVPDAQKYRQMVAEELKQQLEQIAPPPPQDGRKSLWRIRIRLYEGQSDVPAADTDPELEPDQWGSWAVAGMDGIARAVASVAAGYHPDREIAGLDSATMAKRIRGFRPTLSRRGGNGVWRLPYEVDAEPWLCRVDVIKDE